MSPSTARTGPRKVRLDRSLIVEAGLKVAAESRSCTFSAKELGERLGVDPTAIYRHFRNKGHLMEALLDELHVRMVKAVSAVETDWKNRIRNLAIATLREYTLHPSVAAEAVVVTTHGPGELAEVELLLSALDEAGLQGNDVVEHYALISSYILSTASGIARSRIDYLQQHAGEVSNVLEIDTPWLDGPLLADPRTHPHIARYITQLAELRDEEIYLAGVDTLLNAAEQAGQNRS